MVDKHRFEQAVRLLQGLFAIIVLGTVASGKPKFFLRRFTSLTSLYKAIHGFRGYSENINIGYGDDRHEVTVNHRVPDAWGFLMFCAIWTILIITCNFVMTVVNFGERVVLIGYTYVGMEAIAVLSWLAGFIAVAIEVSVRKSCSSNKNACALLTAATVFGGLEFLLFVITVTLTLQQVFGSRPTPLKTKQSTSEV